MNSSLQYVFLYYFSEPLDFHHFNHKKWGRSCVASWFSERKNPDTVNFLVAATGKCHDGTSRAASVFNTIWTRFSCTCDNSPKTDRDYNATRTSNDRCYKCTSVLNMGCFFCFFNHSFGTMSSWSGILMSVTASPGFLSLWSSSGLQTSSCMSCEFHLCNCFHSLSHFWPGGMKWQPFPSRCTGSKFNGAAVFPRSFSQN